MIGLGFGLASVRGFGLYAPNALTRALLASAVGLLVGLIAGRPVWAHGAKTEAALKGFAGALVGAGLSLALGHWLTAPVDLSPFALGVGPAGHLLALNLPAIACALALFFELDDSGVAASKPRGPAPEQKRRLSPLQGESRELSEFDSPPEERARTVEKR